VLDIVITVEKNRMVSLNQNDFTLIMVIFIFLVIAFNKSSICRNTMHLILF